MDFTSSLYLGMKHSSNELKGWQQLTTGIPAALGESGEAVHVASYAAGMQGLESGLVAPSTLHLYWDLFDFLSHRQVVVFIDEKVYPVSRYGIEKLLLRKIPIHTFRHFDATHVTELVKKNCSRTKIPVIISDGWCPACGGSAPLQRYTTIVKPLNGWVIVDDTQAFGILGAGKHTTLPYGKGGGGLLQWQLVRSTTIVTIVSLAKGFGTPMSVISGPGTFIESFAQHSQTRVNSSPVSQAHLHAAMNAFHLNKLEGDTRRAILWRNICLFRSLLQNAGIAVQGGIFPVQTIHCRSRRQTIWLWETLKRKKIRTVLMTPHEELHPVLTFIIRSDHQPGEIQALTETIKKYPLLFKPFDYVNTTTGNINRTGSTQNATR